MPMLLALLGAVASPLLLGPGLLVIWALDATQSLSLVYHFHSPADFAAAAKYIQHLHVGDFLSIPIVGVAVAFAATGSLMFAIVRRFPPRAWALLAATGALVLLDVANGSGLPAVLGSDRVRLSVNVQGSPLLNLVSASLHARDQASLPMSRWPAERTAAPDIADWARQHPDGAVLVVLVESWGWHVDAALRDWTAQRLATGAVTSRFDVRMSATPFRGSTTAGELRTLCGLAGHYSRLHATQAAGCLPNRLAALGFDSVGLHGFSSRMFERHRWWPLLGLGRTVFAEDLPPTAPRCGGAFEGICDDHLLELAAGLLKPRRLVYVLTLNTHLPLKPMALTPELTRLCQTRQVSESVCQLTGQLGRLLDQVADVVLKAPGPLTVVVAGDHSPPFLLDADRLAFSQTEVPHFTLTTR